MSCPCLDFFLVAKSLRRKILPHLAKFSEAIWISRRLWFYFTAAIELACTRKVIFLVLAEIRLCRPKRGAASAHGGVKAVLYGGLRGGRL